MEEIITHQTRCRRCRRLALVDRKAGLAEVYAAKHDQSTETVLGPGIRDRVDSHRLGHAIIVTVAYFYTLPPTSVPPRLSVLPLNSSTPL